MVGGRYTMLRGKIKMCELCDMLKEKTAAPQFVNLPGIPRVVFNLEEMLPEDFYAGHKRIDRGYSFQVSTEKQIDVDRILEDLSHSDPVRLLEYNDEFHIVIHKSVGHKLRNAVISTDDIDTVFTMEHTFAKVKTKKDVNLILNRIREIRRAPWLKSEDEQKNGGVTVKVTAPNV